MSSPPRVLVVDDGLLNIEIATYLLTKAGMQVATALDGIGVLAQVAAFAPDIVLMDIQLPGLDGLALTRQLRAQPATRVAGDRGLHRLRDEGRPREVPGRRLRRLHRQADRRRHVRRRGAGAVARALKR